MTISEVSTEDRRNAFYELISKDNLAPLWQRLHSLVPKSPVTPVVPVHWACAAVSHLSRFAIVFPSRWVEETTLWNPVSVPGKRIGRQRNPARQ